MAPFSRTPKKFYSRGMNLNVPPDDIPEYEYSYIQNLRAYEDGRFETRPGLSLVTSFTPRAADDYINSFYTLNDTDPDSTGGTKRFICFNDTLYFSSPTFPAAATAVDSGFSENPLSMIGMSPLESSVPFLYVYDSLHPPNKYSATYLTAGVPFAFPIGAPQTAVYAALAPIPTFGAGNITGTGYQWRFQLRHVPTGAKSIPGVATYTPQSLTSQDATFTDPAILITGSLARDQEYTWDIFRLTGATWRLVGTITNRSGNTARDNFQDIELATAPTLDVSSEGILYQPWLTEDIPRAGTTTSTAPAVATASGVTGGVGSRVSTATGFNVRWIPGTTIFVNGVACTISSVISPQTLYVDQDLGGNLGAVSWSVEAALRSGSSLPYVWGPYGSGETGLYLFACGDPRNPGKIYWTNGNDPDSTSLRNALDICGPAEAMQNGCVWNGRSWAWSTERMWEIVPDLAILGQFRAQVVPGNRGLYQNWCFCTGDVIYWRSRDGIFKFGGGGLPESISDHQLYELLGHDGQNGFGTTLFNPDNPPSPIVVNPPDPDKGKNQRMLFDNGVIYFDYVDTSNNPTTLLLDLHKRDYTNASPAAPGWMLDRYGPGGYSAHYNELGFNTVFVASGRRLYWFTGDTEDGLAINFALMTGADLLGELRAIKLIGDATVGAAPGSNSVTAKLLGDRNSVVLASSALLTGGAYQQTIITVDNTTVETATESQTIGLWISGSSTARCVLTDWESSWVLKPEKITQRMTDWTDDGQPGDKYLYGFILEADTFGVNQTVNVLVDGNVVAGTFTVNHAIQASKPYAFTAPRITHQMRLQPTNTTQWQLFKVTWLYTLKPELSKFIMDWTDDGFPGPKYLQGFVLEADTEGQNVSLELQYDGGQSLQTFTVNHNGQLEKPYAVTTPIIVHEMKLVPTGNNIRYWLPTFKIAWVYAKWPELTTWVPDFSATDPFGYRGVAIEADTGGVDVAMDVVIAEPHTGLPTTVRTLTVNHNGRVQKAYAFGETIITTEIKLVPSANIRIGLSPPPPTVGSPENPWRIRWIGEPRPDLAGLWTDYTDDGYQFAKFFQGFILWADTEGIDVTLTIEYDGGNVGGVFTKVNHPGQLQVAYSFATPFTAHMVRVVPNLPLRYMGPWKIQWVWEPAPELAKHWITQTTSWEWNGFHHHRDTYLALQSFDNVLLRVIQDVGNGALRQYNYLIPSTGGEIRRLYDVLLPMKAKLSEYHLISCKPFRVWQKDCDMNVKQWGSTGAFVSQHPFGGLHFERGARI